MEWTKAQAAAINVPRRDVLVAAAAGSGKTATLTERVLRTITREKDPVDINRLLIVTFTDKAAEELRVRIRKKLEESAKKDPSDARIKRQLSLLPSASVSTIHSFYGRVVREGAAELGLSPKLRTMEEQESALMIHRIMDRVIDSYYEGDAGDGCDIEDADALFDVFEKLRPGEELYRTMNSLYKSVTSYPEYIEFYRICAEKYEKAAKDPESGEQYAYVTGLYIGELRDVLSRLRRMDTEYDDDPKYVSKYRPLVGETADYAELAISAAENGFDAAESFFRYEAKFELPKGLKGSFAFRDEYKVLSKRVTSAAAALRKFFSFDRAEASMIYGKTAVLCDGIYRFLKRFDRMYTEEKKAARMIDFDDMERYAYRLICGDPSFCARIAERYDEIYVDEYQDVNGVQNDIFAALGKSNRFMVGDVKQSIYAFRGSDPGIFTSYRNGFGSYKENSPGPSVIFLSENFRCGKPIIDFTNRVFGTVFGSGGPVPYEADDALVFGKTCNAREDVPVTLRIITKGKKEDEAEYAAAEIERLLKEGRNDAGEPLKPSDIAILCRNAATCSIAEKALSARGLGCVNTTDISFFNSAEVLLAVSLLSAIDNPVRDVPLAASMKSPVFGFTLDELALIRAYKKDGSLYDAVRAYAETENGGKCRKFLERLDHFRYKARTMQTDKFIRLLYRETSILSLIYNSADRGDPKKRRANLLTLYDLARKYESDSFKGLYGFVTYCNEMIDDERSFKTQSDSADRVTIQTIHGSKGLEYPVCFILGADASFNSDYSKSPVVTDHDLGVGIRVTGDDGFMRKGPAYSAVCIKKETDAVRDEACLFYVAMTRAKKYLYITASTKKEPEFNREASQGAVHLCKSFLAFLTASLDGNEDFCRIICGAPEEYEETAKPRETAEAYAQDDERYARLKAIYDYRYPYAEAAKLPKKAAVSKLFPAYLDEDDSAVSLFDGKEPLPIILPDLSEDEAKKDAAARGTATHLFMQFCDLDRAAADIHGEAERLVREGYIKAETAELISYDEASSFFRSDLYRRMKDARDSGRIFRREYRFNTELDAADFTDDPERKKALENESLLVQGVIDCFFEEKDGTLTVADYKTDRVYPEDASVAGFAERHRRQLSYYKTAVERIARRPVGRCELYSFSLGRSVVL